MSIFQPVSEPIYACGYHSVVVEGHLTLGIDFPIEVFSGSIPTMLNQFEIGQRAERSGLAALWSRGVPLHQRAFAVVRLVDSDNIGRYLRNASQ